MATAPLSNQVEGSVPLGLHRPVSGCHAAGSDLYPSPQNPSSVILKPQKVLRSKSG